MRSPFRSKILIPCMLALGLASAQTPTLGGKLYKWVDENGHVRYGDRIPPQYAKQQRERLNERGIVVETKAAAKTPEQIAEERRKARLAAEEKRRQEEKAARDRILLDTFTNEDEMVMTRDGKIEAVEAIIRITHGRIDSLRQRLANATRRAANIERAGKPVPERLRSQINESRKQISQNLAFIERKKVEQEQIRRQFERDIKRFRELKEAEAKARAEAEAKARAANP